MALKQLSVSEWKVAAKGLVIKDDGLLKALAAYEAARQDPAKQLDALDLLEKPLSLLIKAHKADKPIATVLLELEKLAAAQHKAATLKAAQAKAQTEDTEEDDGPQAMTTKLAPLLQQVRKGVTMQVMLGNCGKSWAVLMSRKSLTASSRALVSGYLKDQLEASGSAKFLLGECLFEANMHTFVMQAKAAGLAKHIRAALFQQTGLRIKVRVRGDSPGDVDEDASDDESSAPVDPNKDPVKNITTKLSQLQPAIKQALLGPGAAQVKLLVQAITEALKSGKTDIAAQALVRLVPLLKPTEAPTPSVSSAPSDIRPGVVDYAKCRLAWLAARKKVQEDLRLLEDRILAEYADDGGIEQLRVKIRKLDTVLEGFAGDLDDVLDSALNATDTQARQALHLQAAQMSRQFLQRAQTDPFIEQLHLNPFVPVAIKGALVNTLGALVKQLG